MFCWRQQRHTHLYTVLPQSANFQSKLFGICFGNGHGAEMIQGRPCCLLQEVVCIPTASIIASETRHFRYQFIFMTSFFLKTFSLKESSVL